MKTIKNNTTNEIEIKNSRFICLLYKITSEEEVKSILKSIKLKYKDASHYCYGYIINDVKRSSDDSEPAGTAGIPILSTLESNKLNLVLSVVIRYFGGVKLGGGGLIRAYRRSVNECIKQSELVTLKRAIIFEITFKYEDTKDVDNLLYSMSILNKEYDEDIKYTVATINLSILDRLKDYNIKIIKDTLVER